MNPRTRAERRTRLARLSACAVGVAVAVGAYSYESDLNVARPAVLRVGAPPASSRSRRPPARRLVWVLVDGLRLDVSREEMPNLNRLRAEGEDVSARAEFPTYSGPNFVTQASGIEPAGSGVLANGYPGEVPLDSVFRRAKMAGLRTAAVTTDEDNGLGQPYASWLDETRGGDTLEHLPVTDLLVVHNDHTDELAHAYGALSKEYRAGIRKMDAVIGRIASTLDPTRDALIVTSDHGNLDDGGHGGTEPEVMAIPIVVWGAGVARGRVLKAARARDVGPTIAALLGIGPLCHATGRPLVHSDKLTAEQRQAVCAIVGNAGWRRTDYMPMVIPLAMLTFLALGWRAGIDTRSLVTAPVYALAFAGVMLATNTLSFSLSNDSALFGIRLTVYCVIAGAAQLLAGGRASLTPAAFVTSLAVFGMALVAARQPLAPPDGMFRFLPIPSLTSLAFICLMAAGLGTHGVAGADERPDTPRTDGEDVATGMSLAEDDRGLAGLAGAPTSPSQGPG
jgi:hypothetical protein